MRERSLCRSRAYIRSTMNYLAHLFLADPTPESRVGSLLADFTHVPNSRLTSTFGDTLADAILQHRRVDAFTDNHPLVNECVSLLFPRQRHAGRIVLDVLFDHFLTLHWQEFCPIGFEQFVGECYGVLQGVDQDDERLPLRFRQFCQGYVEHDVLPTYATLDGVQLALQRIARRVSCENRLHVAVDDSRPHLEDIESRFMAFFPQLEKACAVTSAAQS